MKPQIIEPAEQHDDHETKTGIATAIESSCKGQQTDLVHQMLPRSSVHLQKLKKDKKRKKKKKKKSSSSSSKKSSTSSSSSTTKSSSSKKKKKSSSSSSSSSSFSVPSKASEEVEQEQPQGEEQHDGNDNDETTSCSDAAAPKQLSVVLEDESHHDDEVESLHTTRTVETESLSSSSLKQLSDGSLDRPQSSQQLQQRRKRGLWNVIKSRIFLMRAAEHQSNHGRRKVRFNNKKQFEYTLRRKDYTQAEIRDTWMTEGDLKETNWTCARVTELSLAGLLNNNGKMYNGVLRGLEICTVNGARTMSYFRQKSLEAVLDVSYDCIEDLAQAYSEATHQCLMKAIKRAKMDEIEARKAANGDDDDDEEDNGSQIIANFLSH